MSDYTRADGLTARTDTTTSCRCGQLRCGWTEAEDKERDLIEWADRMGPVLYPEMYPDRPAVRTPEIVARAWAERKALQ
jgi:hypothetical protein